MSADLLLLTMPWDRLAGPSFALGLLKAILDGEGIPCEVRHMNVAAMEHFYTAPGEPRVTPEDYRDISSGARDGYGDWVFAVPPFREPPPVEDDPFLALARRLDPERGEERVARMLRMRALVPGFLAACLDEVLAARPRVVGFSTTFSQNVSSLVLARMLKARDPSIKVIFGGANCEGPMGVALLRAFPEIDVVVRGEAERVLPGLMRDLLAGRPPERRPGLCFREGDALVVVPTGGGGPASLDELPLPVFDEYYQRFGKTRFRQLVGEETSVPVESSRGCWWGAKQHCTFCGLNGETMGFRKKSPERFVGELLQLGRKHRMTRFFAVDNILAMSYFRDVLPSLRDLGLDLHFFYETKANLKREEVRLLADAGVHDIQPGIESFSTPILRLMRKGIAGPQNVRLLKWCAEDGLNPWWNILYGFPGEPPEEYDRMAELIPSLTHLPPPYKLTRLALDRFSPYFERPQDYGLENLGPSEHYPLIYPVVPALVADIAYHFKHGYKDGRDPDTYTARLRQEVARWREAWQTRRQALQCQLGPGFLRIVDRRAGLPNAVYTLSELEGRLYLGCDTGATPEHLAATLGAEGTSLTPGSIRGYLDGLVRKRLMIEEDGHYLSLATRMRPALGRDRALG